MDRYEEQIKLKKILDYLVDMYLVAETLAGPYQILWNTEESLRKKLKRETMPVTEFAQKMNKLDHIASLVQLYEDVWEEFQTFISKELWPAYLETFPRVQILHRGFTFNTDYREYIKMYFPKEDTRGKVYLDWAPKSRNCTLWNRVQYFSEDMKEEMASMVAYPHTKEFVVDFLNEQTVDLFNSMMIVHDVLMDEEEIPF